MNLDSNKNNTPTNEKTSAAKGFFFKHKKLLTISVASLLTLGFVGSIVYSVFSGGELLDVEEEVEKTKGLIRLESASYSTSYFENDPFIFDKDNSKVMLVAKDPAIENIVQIEDLPGAEYGFIVSKTVDENGNVVDEAQIKKVKNAIDATPDDQTSEGDNQEGETETPEEEKHDYVTTESEFYENASDIKMTKDMGNIYLVSKRYRDLRIALPTTIVGNLDESKLVKDINYEAEAAKIYKNDVLLTEEDLKTKPDENKPFLSNCGTSPISEKDAANLSGGVCLRNFGSNNMKVDFEIVSKIPQQVDLTIKVCKRKTAATFDSSYVFTVNDKRYNEIDSQIVEAGQGYFQPFALQTVKVDLFRGVNHFVFRSGSAAHTGSPCNFDAITINAPESTIGLMDSIIPLA